MNNSVTTRIEKQLATLSRSEQRVGEWILANIRRAVDASIMEVATAAGVSEPTVVRFCRSVGASGFRDFRTQLIGALQRPVSYLHNDVSTKDEPTDAAIKVLESSVQALVDLREQIVGMPFSAAVTAMAKARQLVFVGLGASGIVARDACHKFFRLGVPCSTAIDTLTILQQAAIAQPDDVYIAVSHTGQWRNLVQAMKLATERGATVIVITDPDAPLADVASLVFACHPNEDTNVFTPMSSRLAQLTLFDALQVALALEMGEKAQKNLRQTKQALDFSRPEQKQKQS